MATNAPDAKKKCHEWEVAIEKQPSAKVPMTEAASKAHQATFPAAPQRGQTMHNIRIGRQVELPGHHRADDEGKDGCGRNGRGD
jgi:hypothetical protein